MNRPRGTTLLLLLALLLASCTGTRPAAPTASRSVADGPAPSHYSVRRGDTLYSIAWQYGLNYHEVARWNGIGQPYTIYPGQRLALRTPAKATRRASTPVKKAPPSPVTRPAPLPKTQPPAPKSVPKPVTQAPKIVSSDRKTRTAGGLQWRWPTRGRLLRTFARGDPARKGIDIVGDYGQPIYAASGGRVVYSGSGLVGYGKLIIIKHNGVYLSAYGYNRELLVAEGVKVAPGQLIAKMGRVDNSRALVHFEIRKHGQPINPLLMLPKN